MTTVLDRPIRKIYLVNEKGGVGKSTIAFHLAGALAHYGSVVLVDADIQETAYRYYSAAERILEIMNHEYEEDLESFESGQRRRRPVKPAQQISFGAVLFPHATSVEQFEEQCANFDYMIVDTPASISRELLNSIMDSDSLVLIPSDTKMSELWTTRDLVAAFAKKRATVRVVQREGQQSRAYAAEELEDAGLSDFILGGAISSLNSYDDAVRNGGTVMDVPMTPSDRTLMKARSQITKLANGTISLLESMEKAAVSG